jgi:hypothetical protein
MFPNVTNARCFQIITIAALHNIYETRNKQIMSAQFITRKLDTRKFSVNILEHLE